MSCKYNLYLGEILTEQRLTIKQYWRRRLFKLTGSKLTAYHESTGQPRATINLANASKLIDDRRALAQKETTGRGGSRRKSGFAEEEEGYMFIEEGFRIRFANGEVIDFYAESKAKKDEWMGMLDGVIGNASGSDVPKWCDEVLKREEAQRRREARKVSAEKRGDRERADNDKAARRNRGIPENEAVRPMMGTHMRSETDGPRPATTEEVRARGEQYRGGRPGMSPYGDASDSRTRSNTLA